MLDMSLRVDLILPMHVGLHCSTLQYSPHGRKADTAQLSSFPIIDQLSVACEWFLPKDPAFHLKGFSLDRFMTGNSFEQGAHRALRWAQDF